MRSFKLLVAAVGAAALVAGCGLNPFGSGQAGLKAFGNLGKAISKPSQIDDERNSKEGTKTVLATGAAKRLAKGTANAATGVDSVKFVSHGGGVWSYVEYVTNKPSDEDPDKKLTGFGMITFRYSGATPEENFSEQGITGIDSFYYEGTEYKSWSGITDSLRLCVKFSNHLLSDLRPGHTWMWGKNISSDIAKGRGDTAFVQVEELDETSKKQYGDGHFFDAHTGSDNSGDSYSFDFEFEVWHMTSYTDYSDNEGELSFALPWGESSDSLYFQIHFYPQYRRTGTVKDSEGVTRVSFDWNEKTDTGTITYYNAEGDVVEAD